ncbi:acyltransferase family protein [Sphingobium yanoikuyae]|uniref:Acyltransferase n=1 Tax=Sphingobium yanoikuyae TaxID=13690 RepID=A0A430BDE3_SPHYA|nr:acyltransferase [Sphingobium yanoikuyae]RSU46764.1 acyltransferase [Sphingobium yanoikuyae]
MQHSSTATRPKINALQVLRAYAALSVMLGHGILEFHATKGTAMPFNEFPLVAGVDIFFVLSGFVMFHTSTGLWGDKRAPLRFWRRRFIRLVPLYWLFTSLMVATLLLLSRHVRSTEFDLWNVLSSYLFIPSERPGGRIAPVLSLGWTLNYEIFFYCLFGLCLRFDRRRGLSLLIGGFCALLAFTAIFPPTFTPLRFWGNSIILEFVAGIGLGLAYEQGRLRPSLALSCGLFLLGGCLLVAAGDTDLPRVIKGGIPACLMLCAALALPARLDRAMPRPLILLGDSSYALYLSHRFVLRSVTLLFGAIAIPAGLEAYLYVATTLGGAVLLSILIYTYVEAPMLRLLLRRPRDAQPAPASSIRPILQADSPPC